MAGRKRTSVLELVIRILIVVLACTSIVMTIGVLMENKNYRREIDELKQQIEQIEQGN